MLNDLVRKVQQTQLPEKDAEAEEFLQQSLGGNPDSIYILAQTVLVQNIALDQAKGQVQQLRQQLQDAQSQFQAPQPVHSTSFLGSLLGTIHETGHGRYEQNRPCQWLGLPVSEARSRMPVGVTSKIRVASELISR